MQPGDVAKIVISSILSLFLIFVISQIYIYYKRAELARASYTEMEANFKEAEKDHAKLQADLSYYLNPANMLKELKARFNYHEPDEKTLILVPQ